MALFLLLKTVPSAGQLQHTQGFDSKLLPTLHFIISLMFLTTSICVLDLTSYNVIFTELSGEPKRSKIEII